MLVYSKAHRYGVNLTRLSYQEVSELVQTKTDLSEVIAENFGANATYVEGLLSRFRSNPDLVDESWRAYFTELLGDGHQASPRDSSENGRSAVTPVAIAEPPAPAVVTAPSAAAAPAAEPKTSTPAPVEPD